MGKVKPRILGLEEVEEQQKKEQKEKAAQKKAAKKQKKQEGVSVVKEQKKEEEKKEELKKEKKPVRKKPRSKRYQKIVKMIDKGKIYSLDEAVSLLKKIASSKFDESVELHLNVDEVGLKGEVELPHSTGKKVKVAVVDDKILEDIEKEKIDFDVLVAHPSFMPKLARLAKILGPKGLMPNPKAGTISPQPEEVVKKFQKGVFRWKTESKFPLVHQMIGKISFDEKKIVENVNTFISSVGVKHIKKAFIKTTMSPSIRIKVSEN